MEYIYAILLLLGGLGAFLMGAKILSDNTERLSNAGIKRLLNKTSKSKLAGVGIGTATTAIVQSSGLTTIMVVGLVNAGIMTLFQATTIIMGANIGTTVTAQIASLQAFKFDQIAIGFAGIGMFINISSKKEKTKSIGYAIAGLGVVFMGLFLMKDSMELFKNKEFVLDLFKKISNPFLLIVLGVFFTALVQSSSAVTSILISMATAGLVIGNGGNSVIFVILGSNIGSCVTAIMSSIDASRNAKRASLIHLMFNVFGSLLFTIILLLWPKFMDQTFGKWFSHLGTQIAMFHTAFNIICTLIFIPFTNVFVRLSELLIPQKTDNEEIKTFLDRRFLSTPSLALDGILRETIMMLDLSMDSLHTALEGFDKRDVEMSSKVYDNNNKINTISKRISDYLVETSAAHLTIKEEKVVSAMHSNNSDIVRISELADNVTKYTLKRVNEDLHFSETVKEQIKEMEDALIDLSKKVKEAISLKKKKVLKDVDTVEDKIDNMRRQLITSHIERMNAGICRPASSSVFINLVSNLERIGDHLTYIAHSIETM